MYRENARKKNMVLSLSLDEIGSIVIIHLKKIGRIPESAEVEFAPSIANESALLKSFTGRNLLLDFRFESVE